MDARAAFFYVLYRWRLHPGQEANFAQAWSEATHLIRTHRGGLGSALSRAPDGSYVAYARWPDRATWKRAGEIPLPENDAFAKMAAAVVSSEPPLELTGLHDLL